MATAYFMTRVTEMTCASFDQEHIPMFVSSNPLIPDRTGYILDPSKDNPVPAIVNEGIKLKKAGADLLAMPCITAHYFHNTLEKKIGLPIIHGISETVKYLRDQGISSVGIMATDGTVRSMLFQNVLQANHIECILPDEKNQQRVMDFIYTYVKAGKDIDLTLFCDVLDSLSMHHAEVVLLGCTELSVIKRDKNLPSGILDVLDVLSRSAVLACGKLRPEFENLITG